MRRCKGCRSKGPFPANKQTRDGLHPYCRKCERERHRIYGKTPRGRAARAWNSLNQRAGNRTGRTPAYSHVEVRMTREQFMTWAVPAFTSWVEKHPDKVPTLDRVKNAGHYEIGNIRLLERTENKLRSERYRNINGCPKGKAWCSGCLAYHPVADFGKCARTKTGLQTMCRKAHREYMRKRRGTQ